MLATLQLDPLAILGLAMADGTPRTSKIAAAVNDQVVVRERFIVQLLSFIVRAKRRCGTARTDHRLRCASGDWFSSSTL
jgi:hypothetical protein